MYPRLSQPLPPSYWGNVWQLYTRIYIEMGELEKAEAYIEKMESLGFGTIVFKKNIYRRRVTIMMQRGEYEKALEYVNKSYENRTDFYDYEVGNTLWKKAEILSHLGRTGETMLLLQEVVIKRDSLQSLEFNRQIDELRIKHEVDALTAEKELVRRRFAYAITGCVLLFMALVVWIYYSRRLRAKNINLAKRILEQSQQYEESKARRNELWHLKKTEQRSSGAPDDESVGEQQLFEELERYMDERQPYTDPLLNRKMLADTLNTNESYLRDCILNIAGATVSDYIMLYRLNHANHLLLQNEQNYTIEAVAINSGFGSRSSFYVSYHNAYGLTPTEFRKASRK